LKDVFTEAGGESSKENGQSKESWSRGPSLDFTPKGWCLPLNTEHPRTFDFGLPPADYL
jgi:hypothetical protein